MDELLDEMKRLQHEELERANKIYPHFASDHEGAAVLREEIDEVAEDMDDIFKLFDRIWRQVRCDGELLTLTKEMQKTARHLAAEAVQVAAMAQKMEIK